MTNFGRLTNAIKRKTVTAYRSLIVLHVTTLYANEWRNKFRTELLGIQDRYS
jgi:hypothetical protein